MKTGQQEVQTPSPMKDLTLFDMAPWIAPSSTHSSSDSEHPSSKVPPAFQVRCVPSQDPKARRAFLISTLADVLDMLDEDDLF